jgi:hypothetical protein
MHHSLSIIVAMFYSDANGDVLGLAVNLSKKRFIVVAFDDESEVKATRSCPFRIDGLLCSVWRRLFIKS